MIMESSYYHKQFYRYDYEFHVWDSCEDLVQKVLEKDVKRAFLSD